jgi:spermidine synthase
MILDVAAEAGWLPRDGLEIAVTDAFAYVQSCSERFDYVAVDLFRGEELAGRAFGKPFLRRLRTILASRAQLAINVFADVRMPLRVSRIQTFFEIREQRHVGGNVVIHARRRR